MKALTLSTITFAQNKTDDAVIAGDNIAVTNTENGKVRGYIHNGIYTYKGIPYAKSERFTAPEKPNPWTEVRSSMTYGPVCPTDPTTQVNDAFEFAFDHNLGYNNEHCQTLNIWTQKLHDFKKRPVMVWLHGGGFTAGSSIELPSYDGEALAKKGDVVLVSVNHRLNVLGFLDLSAYGEKYNKSANSGLWDIVAALQWLKDNISEFGGDPSNITIFGQSGGGGKVTCMMNAPVAKGLFHKAIIESGSYITEFSDKSVHQKIGAALLEELNLQPSQVDSLQKISYEQLNNASKKAIMKVSTALKAVGKNPMGVGWNAELDGVLLPFQPTDKQALELSQNIPLMIGSTKNEFTPFIPINKKQTLAELKENLNKKYNNKADVYFTAVKKLYPNSASPSDFTGIDLNFRALAIKQANLKSANNNVPVYMYLFTWQSPVNGGMYKAMHGMDIAFEFDNIKRCEQMTGGGKDAYALAAKMSSAWISFARTGNPNVPSLPVWPPYTEKNGSTMLFDIHPLVSNHPDLEIFSAAGIKL